MDISCIQTLSERFDNRCPTSPTCPEILIVRRAYVFMNMEFYCDCQAELHTYFLDIADMAA
jgi:hypothetical protein